jgi:hypothetical protein
MGSSGILNAVKAWTASQILRSDVRNGVRASARGTNAVPTLFDNCAPRELLIAIEDTEHYHLQTMLLNGGQPVTEQQLQNVLVRLLQ